MPLRTLRSLGRGVGFAVWTSGVVYSHQVFQRFDSELRTATGKKQFIDTWSRGAIPLLGVDLTVQGEHRPGVGENYLVVANHSAPLDILVCVNLVGGVVLSHHGVADIPVVGHAAKATDTIFVDRDDQRSGAQAIRQMRRRLKEGRNVIVFPEGTTFEGDEVRPFKRGAFSAAKGLPNVRCLPLGIAYEPGAEFVNESFGAHAKRMSRRARTPIWASIGEPVDVPRNAEQVEALRERVQVLATRSAQARDGLAASAESPAVSAAPA